MLLFFFGDSITLGFRDPAGLGWAGRIGRTVMAAGKDITVYNLGVRKDASPRIAARWKGEVTPRLIDGTPAKFIFSFGVADAMTGTMPTESLEAARTIVNDAKGMGDILLVGPTPVLDSGNNMAVTALDGALEELCSELRVPYAPTHQAMSANLVYQQSLSDGDTIHPTTEGCDVLAEHLLSLNEVRTFFGIE